MRSYSVSSLSRLFGHRFAVRHVIRLMSRDSEAIYSLLSKHVDSLKHLLFPRSLRSLPLPNQCAAVDAVAFIVERAPSLIPIGDKHLHSFLSELLKVVSMADGEFADPTFNGQSTKITRYSLYQPC